MIYFVMCLLVVLCGLLVYLLMKSLTLNRNYEAFFDQSIDDLHSVINGIDLVLIKRLKEVN